MTRYVSNLSVFAWGLLALLLVACKSDDSHDHGDGGHHSDYPSCDAIIQACHPYDVGEGPVHDCHDLGHGALNDSECASKKDDCLKICAAAADGGTAVDASDASASDASGDGSAHMHDM